MANKLEQSLTEGKTIKTFYINSLNEVAAVFSDDDNVPKDALRKFALEALEIDSVYFDEAIGYESNLVYKSYNLSFVNSDMLDKLKELKYLIYVEHDDNYNSTSIELNKLSKKEANSIVDNVKKLYENEEKRKNAENDKNKLMRFYISSDSETQRKILTRIIKKENLDNFATKDYQILNAQIVALKYDLSIGEREWYAMGYKAILAEKDILPYDILIDKLEEHYEFRRYRRIPRFYMEPEKHLQTNYSLDTLKITDDWQFYKGNKEVGNNDKIFSFCYDKTNKEIHPKDISFKEVRVGDIVNQVDEAFRNEEKEAIERKINEVVGNSSQKSIDILLNYISSQ